VVATRRRSVASITIGAVAPAIGSVIVEVIRGEMKQILKIIEEMIDALAQILAPQKPIVTGSYLARRDAMRRWQDHWYENRYR